MTPIRNTCGTGCMPRFTCEPRMTANRMAKMSSIHSCGRTALICSRNRVINRFLGLLNEFLDIRGEKLIAHPLKRTLLQHDLWAIFDWLADPSVEHVSKTAHLGAQRRALRNRLALVIRRV